MTAISIQKALNRANVVMKVLEYDKLTKKQHEEIVFPAILQKKEDGVYCLCIRALGEPIQFYSRTGKPFYIEGHTYINLANQVPIVGGVFICELTNYNCSLEVLSGLVNTNRVTPWTEQERELMSKSRLIVHDYLWLDEFILGESKRPYHERFDRLSMLYFNAGKQKYVVRSIRVNNYKEFIDQTDEWIAAGEEGGVLKMLHAGWVAGHKGWRQTKRVRGFHKDLRCTGVIIGKGKMAGLIAGLKFKWKGKEFTAGLGKGWDTATQEAHTMAWQQDEFNVVNQIWHVSGLQESSKGVVRLPKVNELRVDKHIEDTE